MNVKKRVALFAAVLTASAILAGCGQTKVGYIDSARIMEAPQIKSALEEGNKKIVDAQKEAMADLENSSNLSDEEKTKRQQQIQRRIQGINQQYINKVQTTLNAALASIAEEQKLDAVVEHNKMDKIVIVGGIDVTDAALAKLQ